jgi:transposase
MARTPPTGRPTKLTDEVAREVAKHIRQGLPRDTAGELVGIGTRTFYRWMAVGKKAASGRYRQFWREVKTAEAAAVAVHAATIRKAALGWTEKTIKERIAPDGTKTVETTSRRVFDWTAAAWWLERRNPEQYSSERKRIRELEKMLIDLMKQIDELKVARGVPVGGR